jgi:hypothetical protein
MRSPGEDGTTAGVTQRGFSTTPPLSAFEVHLALVEVGI